jgi:lipopolysaccharide export system protein LptA
MFKVDMKLLNLSLILSLVLSHFAYALSTDSQKPIYIDSDSQQLDLKSNQVTFVGHVKLKQGSIKMNADEVIVMRNAKDGSIQEIKGFGNLATFSQLTDEGKTLYGEAKTLHYTLKDDLLTMTDKAMLSQGDSTIRSNKIRYSIAEQQLNADGNATNRVSTVLQPPTPKKK